MHGQYPSLSDPDKQNFFLPTHHSRKLRHLRGKVLQIRELTGIEGVCETADHHTVPPLKQLPQEKKVSKEELQYHEAYRGRNIDPFSSVSENVSFDLFLPPLVGQNVRHGLLSEGIWWDVPKKKAKRQAKASQEIHLPKVPYTVKSTQSLLDEYIDRNITRNITTRLSKKRPQPDESSLLKKSMSKQKLSIKYLDKENIPHRLPMREWGRNMTEFDFYRLNNFKEDKQMSKPSKRGVLPPIETLGEQEIDHATNESEPNFKDSEVAHECMGEDNVTEQNTAADPNNLELADAQGLLQTSGGNVAEGQSFDVPNKKESQKRKATNQAVGAVDVKQKRKNSGYHRSVNRVRRNLRNGHNIRMLDGWIDLLESMEFISIPQVNASNYFSPQMKTTSNVASKFVQPIMQPANQPGLPSSIDVMDFFDKPKSAIVKFDQLRSLNRQTMLIKASQCSRDTISHKCKEEVLAANSSSVQDKGTLASLLAVHGLGHLMNKPRIRHESGYLLHKTPKRLLTGHDRQGQHRDKRPKTQDDTAEDDFENTCQHKPPLQQQSSSVDVQIKMSVSTTLMTTEKVEMPEVEVAAICEAQDETSRTASFQASLQLKMDESVEAKLPVAPKKSFAKSVFEMALPSEYKAANSTQDLKGKKLVQTGRQTSRSKSPVAAATTGAAGGFMLQLPEPVPTSSSRIEKDSTRVVETNTTQAKSVDTAAMVDEQSELSAIQEYGYETLTTTETAGELESTEKCEDEKVDVSMKSVGTLKRGKRKPSQLESTQLSEKDISSGKSSHHGVKTITTTDQTPRITILNQQGDKKQPKIGKFLYSSSKKGTGPSIKRYSTCLIEGGSMIYRHTIVPLVTKTQAIDEAIGKFAFLRRKNLSKLKKRGKGKSVKKINPLLKYGIPQGMLPTAMLLMSASDLPADKQLHYLSKEKLDAIKKHMRELYPDIPEEAWDDPEVLVSLLPSLINSGVIDIETLMQFSDEVITAALDKCDIDALLARPDIMKDPCLYKRILAEKKAREAGLTGAAKEKLREFINKNMEIFVDHNGNGFVPVVPPAVAKLREMVNKAAASGGKLKMDESEIIEALATLEEEYGKQGISISNDQKMIYDPVTKQMVKLDTVTITHNNGHVVEVPCRDCSAKQRKWRRKDQREKKRKMRELEEAEIIIERREGETSAEFKIREKKERKEIMRRRRHEARLREEAEIVIERREGETSAEFWKREKKERQEIMRRRRWAEKYGEEEDIVIERLEGENSAEFRKRKKRIRREFQKKREKEYDNEIKERWERKVQRREERRRRRERGDVVSTSSDSDSSLERWHSRKMRRRRRYDDSDSDYTDSDEDYERAERTERCQQRRDRRRRREAGEDVSSSSYFTSSCNSSDSYFDSSYDSSSYFDSSSYYSDSNLSSATRRRRRKRRERKKKLERKRQKRREAGIEGSSDSYSYHSSDSSSSMEGLDKEERRRKKERRERRRRKREEVMLLSPESRKRQRKERREEQREERRKRMNERLGLPSGDKSAAALMKEIGEVMEVIKYVRDAAGHIVATTLRGTRSAIRKMMLEKQYYDDPWGEICAMWGEDSIPDLEPFDDAPGYYNEDGEYIEYTPEERQRRREEYEAAVKERDMLIAARQKKWERYYEEDKMRRVQSSLARKNGSTSKKSRYHEIALQWFRRQEERRRLKEFYENQILEEYTEICNTWKGMEYISIAYSMGKSYTAKLKRAEIAREEEERAQKEMALIQLQARRNHLLRRLQHTKQEFFLNSEVEASKIAEILRISRSFVFSYYDNMLGNKS